MAEEIKEYYVSLTKDLLGYYLVFRANSELAVRQYLEQEYFDCHHNTWKLPWCAIYTKKQILKQSENKTRYPVIEIYPSCGVLYEQRSTL